jgi:cytochrome c peroxidase
MRSPTFAVALTILSACGPPTPLTEAERSSLELMVLDEGAMPIDPTNAWSDDPAAAALGQKFFFDTRFSGPIVLESDLGAIGESGKISCASCHDPAQGGADRRSASPTSHGSAWTARNAPTVLNSAYTGASLFWDGRSDSLWSQALKPSEASVEHNGSRLYFAHLISELYRAEYETVFGPMPDMSDAVYPPKDGLCDTATCLGKPDDAVWTSMNPEAQQDINLVFANFGKAIAAYERLLVTPNSPFDEYMRGDTTALDASALRGAQLFVGKASCNDCHWGAVMSNNQYHNLGVPQLADADFGLSHTDEGRSAGIDLLLGDVFNAAGPFSDAPEISAHLDGLEVTPEDLGAFKTPTLRNVGLTAPYMHNGSLATLRDVVDHYRIGGLTDQTVGPLDPMMAPLHLSPAEVDDLVQFLEALTGSLPPELTVSPELPL